MARRAARPAPERLVADALLVRRVAWRESDDIVHLFTDRFGAVAAVARGARRSQKRFAALEPMHVLRVGVDVTAHRELGTLAEASLRRPRIGIMTRLPAVDAAGRALRWLRAAAPPRSAEPLMWDETNRLLDALDAGEADAERLLAAAGLRLLAAAGWALELEACVRCGRVCPDAARAIVDVHAGGIVCRHCGGQGSSVGARQRRALTASMAGAPFDGDPEAAVALVDAAFLAHGRGEAT
ncbi:MAG: DNA repair protein RecO [Myxococcota bacterium]